MYYDAQQYALRRCQGVQSDADYFMNCSYFQWYERVMHSTDYAEWTKPK